MDITASINIIMMFCPMHCVFHFVSQVWKYYDHNHQKGYCYYRNSNSIFMKDLANIITNIIFYPDQNN